MSLPILAITMGDPAGIGPEIIAKALCHPEVHEICRPIVVGDLHTIRAAVSITGVALQVRGVDDPAAGGRDRRSIDVLSLSEARVASLERGKVSAAAGRAAYVSLEYATRLALDGRISGVVTAPLNKEGLSQAGWVGVGHTELLARFCGIPEESVAMLLVSDQLRVVHVSTHVPLRRAIELVTVERVVTTARLGGKATRDIIKRAPRIAVAGLNPHAGEHGLFGWEDEQQIVPAVHQLAAEGWDVTGPIPPDTVFLRARNREFDCVVAMYHDQGHIPSKLGGFDDTVNVTLGLPIIRTSVDHGTAYDVAGTGKASEDNLVQAIKVAAAMARIAEA
jgi:4-phospho-D-threonate 3-dehydrogenase / 4-phospho-D-erythronate 3-dehydrogenase